MSIRKLTFTNDQYYHVFNRGVDKRTIFTDQDELNFFLHRLSDLNSVDTSPSLKNNRRRQKVASGLPVSDDLVKIVAYCLLPNHYHLLLKQNIDDGISRFMQRLGTSYVKFFNKKQQRSGSLFQGKFKATLLNGNYALPTVASYINLNYKHHQINPSNNLVGSSMNEYLAQPDATLCDPEEVSAIIKEVGGLEAFKQFAQNASITFASNKKVILTAKDFEF